MNETQIAELLENFVALTKEVAENRRQINELIQEVGILKNMNTPYDYPTKRWPHDSPVISLNDIIPMP